MPEYPILLQDFTFREPADNSDRKLIQNVQEYGWGVIGIPDDAEGPGFSYTAGVYLRTLQPEILIMGLSLENAHRILNGIARYLLEGGTLQPEVRYPDFIESFDVFFRPIDPSQYNDHLGCANWFYRWCAPFPALQCFWPDKVGKFPEDPDFNPAFKAKQIDLSRPANLTIPPGRPT